MAPRLKSVLLPLVGALAAVALGGADNAPKSDAGAAKPGPQRSCFLARNVSSWAAQDDTTVNLRVNVRDYYQLKLLGPCNNIDWDQAIGIEHRGSSWICSGLDAVIITRGKVGPPRCPVSSVRKLTKEEVAALPARARP
jgi:hypothetical protein